MTRKPLAVLATVVGALAAVPTAQAATNPPHWQCRASALYASVNGQNRVEPIVANGNINTANGVSPDLEVCSDNETGAGNTATQLGIPPNVLGAVTGKAKTAIDPDMGNAIDQSLATEARVEDLTLLGQVGLPAIGVGAANSTATATCSAGSTVPKFDGDSRVADITLGGQPIPLDQLATQLTNLLNPILGAIVEIKVDERVSTPTGLTVRAIHVKVLRGATSLVDLVVGEAKVAAAGDVCNPAAQPGGDGNGDVCPAGSVARDDVCVITAGTGGSSLGDVIIGRPNQSPSGGTVVPIDVARRLYGRTPCLSGNGTPKFAIIGTNKADRITGTNVADRIIGLGGNDKLDGGRGNDCIEGRTGGDTMSGGLGNDSEYGSSGKDHLNGGPGKDYLSGGTGNDTLSASFGGDRVLGGDGVDFINIATAGGPASADCGAGRDKIRLNRNEAKKIRNCETVYVFRDK
jgi:Ca2+-binding RTX toxin-like protein